MPWRPRQLDASTLMKLGRPKLQKRRGAQPERRPLLVIDGDSFAHRAYHALPKNILRDGDRPAGAILGFANRLLQLYRAEQPRAVLVGWDTLDAPPTGMMLLPTIKADANSTTISSSSLRSFPNLSRPAAFPLPSLPDLSPT